ncbi:hypothetical protein [Naasia aerilata]|uniref:Uncharacterized protein n=1 Tax=Naasia aerilata TaxID=1162966 RepID=A0ABM8GGD6_9MICO|nr:hypothetical protein [Naasia aerilata]BDZ47420.1 hypothetical protein GCM10025866_33290 [Naasia aerilata]
MNSRIYVRYGDQDYAVADRSLDELRAEIDAALSSGGWVPVYFGEGRATRTELLITPGVSLSIREETEPEPS